METITVGGLTAARGEKKQGLVHVPGTEAELPVTLIAGKQPGKTMLITGGIHSAEYVGIEAAIQLSAELEPGQLAGNVIIISVANPSGFARRTMRMLYGDGKNANWEFQEKADYYIGLHCGDGYEELTPYTYYTAATQPEVAELSCQMAFHTAVPYVAVSRSHTGSAYHYAASQSIPSVLLERGCLGRWSQQEVEADKKDVKNILRFLGLLCDEGQVIAYAPQVITEVSYIEASHTGCWYPRFHAGDHFQEGQVLGVVKDCFGHELETCRASYSGVILYQTASLNVLAGGPMVAYGKI